MSQTLVHRFRSRWLDSPLPMVVEHRPGVPESICAAPSLWMGGKLVAERLRAEGIGEGHRVRYEGPAGAGFVQALVGTWRTGAAFHAEDLASLGMPAHAVVRADLSVEVPPLRPPTGAITARLLSRGEGGRLLALDESELDALASDGVALLDGRAPAGGESLRVGCVGDWTDGRLFAVEVLGALLHEAEVHLGTRDVPTSQLDGIGSRPHVYVAHVLGSTSAEHVALSERPDPAVHVEGPTEVLVSCPPLSTP